MASAGASFGAINGSDKGKFPSNCGDAHKPCGRVEVKPSWIHPEFGEVTPERFIPIAEETGIIHELSMQILRQACVTAAGWPDDLTLSIDVLESQLKDKELKDRILGVLRETDFPIERLEIEITEITLVRNLEAAQHILGALRSAGARIALDNFGTGYSSLYHLRNFKMDKVKIDSSFIRGMLSKDEEAGVVRGLVGLAQGLGITIAAEGVRNADQQTSLLLSGCEQGQGQLYSSTLSANDALKLLRTNSSRYQLA